MWIFGYGSLLWHQNFPYEKVVAGIVHGYTRRFWQWSPDHRGTSDAPGRTVTLVNDPKGCCWGLAFKVPEKDVAATRAYLDHREKAGYELVTVAFIPDDAGIEQFNVDVYMTNEENEHYAGPSDIEDIAQIIVRRVGPSGPNIEYALKLASFLHKQSKHYPDDDHIFALEKRILELSEETGLGVDVVRNLGYPRTKKEMITGKQDVHELKEITPYKVTVKSATPFGHRRHVSTGNCVHSDEPEQENLLRKSSEGCVASGNDASTFTRKKLSETRDVSHLPKLSVQHNVDVDMNIDFPTLASPSSASPITQVVRPNREGTSEAEQGLEVKTIRIFFTNLAPETAIGDDGSSGVEFVIEGGRYARADQLLTMMAVMDEIDTSLAHEEFALWMLSPLLEIQLKPHHMPYEVRAGWKEILARFASQVAEDVRVVDEPVLFFKRNVHLSIDREVELMSVKSAVEVAGLGFALDCKGFDETKHTLEFVRQNLDSQLPEFLADSIRGAMLFGKSLNNTCREHENSILRIWQVAAELFKNNSLEVERQYLAAIRDSCPSYGAAFFNGTIERPMSSLKKWRTVIKAMTNGVGHMNVLIAVNCETISVIDEDKHEYLLVQKVEDCAWKMVDCVSEDGSKQVTDSVLFLHFPDVEKSEKKGRKNCIRTNLLQVFGNQVSLINAFLNYLEKHLEKASAYSNSSSGQNSAESNKSSGSGKSLVSRTPSLTKESRLVLTSFVNGDCVKANGSLKRIYTVVEAH